MEDHPHTYTRGDLHTHDSPDNWSYSGLDLVSLSVSLCVSLLCAYLCLSGCVYVYIYVHVSVCVCVVVCVHLCLCMSVCLCTVALQWSLADWRSRHQGTDSQFFDDFDENITNYNISIRWRKMIANLISIFCPKLVNYTVSFITDQFPVPTSGLLHIL